MITKRIIIYIRYILFILLLTGCHRAETIQYPWGIEHNGLKVRIEKISIDIDRKDGLHWVNICIGITNTWPVEQAVNLGPYKAVRGPTPFIELFSKKSNVWESVGGGLNYKPKNGRDGFVIPSGGIRKIVFAWGIPMYQLRLTNEPYKIAVGTKYPEPTNGWIETSTFYYHP